MLLGKYDNGWHYKQKAERSFCECTVAQLPDINIKAEILGRKYVSSRCDWGSLTTKPSFSSVTELRAS